MNKEQLQQQVNDMKAKLAEMEAELAEPSKFEWEYKKYDSYLIAVNEVYIDGSGIIKNYLEHGRYRSTEEGAEMSLERNKRANRLEALAEKLGGLKEWVEGDYNYYIFYNDSWDYNYDFIVYHPEQVYMTRECAEEICRMLNEGEFSLDGEI